LQGPVRFYDNERKAYILLKQFLSKLLLDIKRTVEEREREREREKERERERERESFVCRIKQID